MKGNPMPIAKNFAMQIVEEISGIIHQHINFIDEHGIIIASTDPSRIDSLHMGAKRLIDNGLTQLIIASDHEYPGSRKGINLPITVDEKIVGVIGITGDPQEVAKFGEIIRKFTEMTIRDVAIREQKEQRDKVLSRFLENWLSDPSLPHSAGFEKTALSLGVDTHVKRRILVASFAVSDISSFTDLQDRLDRATRLLRQRLCDHPDHHTIRIGARLVFLIRHQSDDRLKLLLQAIIDECVAFYQLQLHLGVDRETEEPNLSDAFHQAQKALSASMALGASKLLFYRDLHLDLFVHEIPDSVKAEFVAKIFGACTAQDKETYCSILKLLYRHNGSIQTTADELFIHKNTLQYQLNRLHQLTGYDPRHTQNIALYTLAMEFGKSLDVK
jgi:carbohydrate diacid regulator